MSYIKLHPIKQFDFQINRILTYGDAACDFEEVKAAANEITDLNSWYEVWKQLGEKAERENRYLHCAYYFRLAEFFLKESSEKREMYDKSITGFHRIIGADKTVYFEYVPYRDVDMKTLVFKSETPKGNLVVFGGYDSFIEEFYLAVKELSICGYNIYLFEGPGQGETLKRGLTFEPHWEEPVKAVLDYFHLNNVCVIGISWGGYLALRTAAFEKRVKMVVAYDVLYDGFDCMTNLFPSAVKPFIRFLFKLKAKKIINILIQKAAEKKLIADWAVSHGQYITGTKTPYDFYVNLKKHTLKGSAAKIECDVLLMAGECDHYIPKKHFSILSREITNAKSLTGKMFTEAEGGAEHCRIGNYQLAVCYILEWLKRFDGSV